MFKKNDNKEKLMREYSNSKYQNEIDSHSFYEAFQKRMKLESGD